MNASKRANDIDMRAFEYADAHQAFPLAKGGRGICSCRENQKQILPNPPGPHAQPSGVRQRTNLWFVSALPHPFSKEGADEPHVLRTARHRRRRPPRPPDLPARHRGNAGVHAGRHLRFGQGRAAGAGARARRRDHPRQHLPPVPAARARGDRGARRPAWIHALGRSDPHRFRRFPGVLARAPAQDHRAGRDLRRADRRLDRVPRPGGEHAHPEGAGLATS